MLTHYLYLQVTLIFFNVYVFAFQQQSMHVVSRRTRLALAFPSLVPKAKCV